jgi:hypothetical protein
MSSDCREVLAPNGFAAGNAVASAVLSGSASVSQQTRTYALRQRTLQPILALFAFGLAFAQAQDDCCVGKQEPLPPNSTKRVLRVTADPNNLPFSNEKREGFENRIAELIAKELNATLQYSWRAQRRGFFRETL